MDTDDRRRATETLKDLIIERKRSRWPKILGLSIVLVIIAGATYWFYLPPDQRPALENFSSRVESFVDTVLNTPVIAPPAAPTSPSSQKSSTPPPSNDSGLLSN